MKLTQLSRRQRILAQCAPISEEKVTDRAMRGAISQARKAEGFEHQQRFDRAVTALAHTIPIPPEIAEWFSTENVIPTPKRTWKKLVRNPAILAILIALGVIAGVFVYQFLEHLNDFPGSATARRMLKVASSTRSMILDPIKTDAGALGDLFFMKHRLAHYDVPPEFGEFRTLGARVFDDEEGYRVAQIWVSEKKMQFFLFPAERDAKTGKVLEFSGWRYLDHEGWTGVVQERNGVCFMAAVRGTERNLAPYISKPKP
ncbi:MAG: hypothetical protein QOI22_1634 [Verrucomicrobiota bacterium]|jgi:hypothetical protein